MPKVERYLQLELIQKINIFNEIYMIDCLKSKQQKNWKDYLDPITRHLYNINYDTLILDNAFDINAVPGILEMYYNIFSYVMKDLKTVDMFKTVRDILVSANEVKLIFDAFLVANNYKVEKVSSRKFGSEKIKFNIYPMV